MFATDSTELQNGVCEILPADCKSPFVLKVCLPYKPLYHRHFVSDNKKSHTKPSFRSHVSCLHVHTMCTNMAADCKGVK